MRVLLTRPHEDAEPLAAVLRRQGIDSLIEPLLEIIYLEDAVVDLAGVQAVLITSANGARALVRVNGERSIPVFCVGDASARVSRELGFEAVKSAGGDVADLAQLVVRHLDPAAGAVLHVAGSAVAGDLAGDLRQSGFDYRRAILYEARATETLSPQCIEALKSGRIDAVFFFSPRTASSFVTLAQRAGLAEAMGAVDVMCLSPQVAERIKALAWRHVGIAERPETEALLALLTSELSVDDGQGDDRKQ